VRERFNEFEIPLEILALRLGNVLHVLSFCEKQPWITADELERVRRQKKERSDFLDANPSLVGDTVVIGSTTVRLSRYVLAIGVLHALARCAHGHGREECETNNAKCDVSHRTDELDCCCRCELAGLSWLLQTDC
jgi:hypothetical protein